MKSTLIATVFLLSLTEGWAQDKYAFNSISEELAKSASAVVRMDEMEFTVLNISQARSKVKYAVTIVNESAKSRSRVFIGYDPNIKVSNIKGYVYDKFGKQVSKLKKQDISDRSAVAGGTIYQDNRVKILDLSYAYYPYTVEYEYETAIDGLLFYPSWNFQSSNRISVENSKLTVTVPSSQGLRYRESNYAGKVDITNSNGQTKHVWEMSNLKNYDTEPYSPHSVYRSHSVITGPKEFSTAGYTGDMTTWKGLGDWINQLNENRGDLPIEVIAEVQELVKGVSDKREKTKLIYEYMQNKTRYVSVQLGIGGFQPFSANYVEQNGYGDCKALSNYTKSLLGIVGIDAIYTLVGAGKNARPMLTDFPSSQFNHAIIAVPMDQDTVWLECTSQTNPFGYQGNFTGDRDVLLITPDGGKVAHTKIYDAAVNEQMRFADVQLLPDGGANAIITTRYSGLQYENVDHQIHESIKDQKEDVYESLDIPSFLIKDIKYEETKSEIPVIKESLEIEIREYTSTSGKRQFFKPNMLNRRDDWPKALKERKNEIVLKFPYVDVDSIHYSLSDQLHVEFLPENVSIESEFGTYSTEYFKDKTGITYVRKRSQSKGKYPAESYDEFVDFLKKIAKADNVKVVLIGST